MSAVREAVIFIPGKGTALLDQSLEAVCDRLLVGLSDTGASGDFSVRPTRHIRYGPNDMHTTRMRGLIRTVRGRIRARIDVSELEYSSDIGADYARLPLLLKSVNLLRTVVTAVRFMVPAFGRRLPKGGNKRTSQMLLAALLVFGLGLYSMALMVILGYQGIKAARPDVHLVPDYVNAVLLALAAIGLASWTTRAQQLIDAFIGDYVFGYFGRGRHQEQLVRQLAELINHLNNPRRYDGVTILAYSFGAILALDCLFPPPWIPEMHVGGVDNLVTIGCPLDGLRGFWPRHFTHRRVVPNPPHRWINVHSPHDVLSSVIGGDSLGFATASTGQVTPCDNVSYAVDPSATLRWIDVFRLEGVIAHTKYWGAVTGEAGCFGTVGARLYGGTGVLS